MAIAAWSVVVVERTAVLVAIAARSVVVEWSAVLVAIAARSVVVVEQSAAMVAIVARSVVVEWSAVLVLTTPRSWVRVPPWWFGVGVTARGGTGIPARLYRIDPRGPVSFGCVHGPRL